MRHQLHYLYVRVLLRLNNMNRPDFLDLTLGFPPTYVKGLHKCNDVSKMPYNILGNTGLKISKLGFGCGFGYIGDVQNPEEPTEAIETVKEAIKYGVNYFDTAPWYGCGYSEKVLGKAFSEIPRQSYYIATKVGRYEPNYAKMFDFSAEKTLASVDESLERLRLDYVDVIQVHDVEFASSTNVIVNETLPALQKVKDSGKAKFIGITSYSLEKLKEIVEKSEVKIDTVLSYSRYTLYDQELLDYTAFFKERGIGIINAAFLGMGLLSTPDKLPNWHYAGPEVRGACEKADQYCKVKGVSLPRLATVYAFDLPDASTHLVGFNSLKFLHENMRNLTEPLDNLEKEVLDYVLENYFKPLKVKNWEGIEVAKYWRKIQALNVSKQ